MNRKNVIPACAVLYSHEPVRSYANASPCSKGGGHPFRCPLYAFHEFSHTTANVTVFVDYELVDVVFFQDFFCFGCEL